MTSYNLRPGAIAALRAGQPVAAYARANRYKGAHYHLVLLEGAPSPGTTAGAFILNAEDLSKLESGKKLLFEHDTIKMSRPRCTPDELHEMMHNWHK